MIAQMITESENRTRELIAAIENRTNELIKISTQTNKLLSSLKKYREEALDQEYTKGVEEAYEQNEHLKDVEKQSAAYKSAIEYSREQDKQKIDMMNQSMF